MHAYNSVYYIVTIIASYIARDCSYMYGLLADSHITIGTYQVAREGSYNAIVPVTSVFNNNEVSC